MSAVWRLEKSKKMTELNNASPQRPIGITIAGVIEIIGGILGVLLSIIAIIQTAGAPYNPRDSSSAIVLDAAIVVLILSVVAIVIAIGLLQMKGWARVITIVMSVITIVLALVAIAFGNSLHFEPLEIAALIIAAINVFIIIVVIALK